MMTNEKLKKIYALAMNGVGGEKEQAKALLDKLLEKYSLSIEDMEEDTLQEFRLEFHGKEQRRLLIQSIYKVTNDPNSFFSLCYTNSGRKCRTLLGVSCTQSQKIEIGFLFDFYCQLWEQEKEALLNAFIQKHEIFGDSNADKGIQYSDDEIAKMYSMMGGLSDAQPYRQLEDSQRG